MTKIMKKSMENHGSAVSQWNTMDLLQVIRKPWTCCKSLENHGIAASHWKTMGLLKVIGMNRLQVIEKPWDMTCSRSMVFE
jgi:hypothetical protein